MVRKKFTFEMLQNFCNIKLIKLIEDYSNININRDTEIKGICITINCEETFQSTFRLLVERDSYYCGKCHKNIINEKRINTLIKNHGVSNPMHSEKIKDKLKETNMNKYGKENPFEVEEFKEKAKETNLKNLGVEYVSQSKEIQDKKKELSISKWGVDHPSKSAEVQQKFKDTCRKIYGVDHPSQNSEIAQKQLIKSFKKKEYKMPSGKIIYIQGYENFALDELLYKEDIKEDDIKTSKNDVPEIWYLDKNKKEHRYYVDIFIKSQNKCIEVKSKYTYESNKDIVEIKKYAIDFLGYDFEFRIYNKQGNRINL